MTPKKEVLNIAEAMFGRENEDEIIFAVARHVEKRALERAKAVVAWNARHRIDALPSEYPSAKGKT